MRAQIQGMAGRRTLTLIFTGIVGSDETLASGRDGASPWLLSLKAMQSQVEGSTPCINQPQFNMIHLSS